MSVEFSNAYQEILLDNLMAVIKQNFVFQTQLKLSENVGKDREELVVRVNELLSECERLKNESQQTEHYKNVAEQNKSAHDEKTRIQEALNNEMKKNSSLNDQLNSAFKEIENVEKQLNEVNEYVKTLESFVPVSKLKKLGKEKIVVEEKNETPKIENNLKKTVDGSSF
jgi:predicted RNase H-like nuclease (RuvC/YqgF family)